MVFDGPELLLQEIMEAEDDIANGRAIPGDEVRRADAEGRTP
jgi:hypothetical protein